MISRTTIRTNGGAKIGDTSPISSNVPLKKVFTFRLIFVESLRAARFRTAASVKHAESFVRYVAVRIIRFFHTWTL